VNLNGFTFDCTTVNEYFNGSSEARKKQETLSHQPSKWVINYPNLIELHEDITNKLSEYLNTLKDKVLHDDAFKQRIDEKYKKSWNEINN